MSNKYGLFAFALCIIAFGSSVANAADLTIRFTGKFVAPTCKWVAGDDNLTVKLDPIDESALRNAGAAGLKTFSIGLTSCDAGLSVASFTFTGNSDPTDQLRYKNNGSATGVAIELESADGQTIGANGVNSTRVASLTSGNAILNLQAGYWRLAQGALTAGSVSAVATVNVTYN